MRNSESIPVNRERRLDHPRFWLSRPALLLFAAGAGALLASQIVHPVKRVIEAAAGLLLAFVLWNSAPINALWILMVIYPFPFSIAIGNSTFVFILISFTIYIVRVSARLSTFRLDRHFNLPIALFLMSYLVSFYNLDTGPIGMRFALIHTLNVIASIFLFYMIINFVDTEERLEKTMRVMMISAAAVITFTILEMLFPGREIIPNWLYTQHEMQLVMKNVRVGGPFRDYELLAEFFAMNTPIIFFMVSRSRRLLTRILFAALLVANIVVLFSTLTRGAFISLAAGLIYMAWACRRDLTFVRFTMLVGSFIALIFIVDLFVARYTISGSLFARIIGTTFETGIVPENRVMAWGDAITRGLQHPIIGHGPGWEMSKGLEARIWPHSAYLFYFNVGGLFGLSAFLLLMWRFWKASSRSLGKSILRSSYPNALLVILNVVFVIFAIDQIKIDYPRHDFYMHFIWIFFGLIAATRNIVIRSERARARPGPSSV